MLWPKIESGARLVEVKPQETVDDLFIWAVIDEKFHQGVVYDDMWYTQLLEEHAGLVLTAVTEIGWDEVKSSTEPHVKKFIEDCRADDQYLQKMENIGHRLFVHHASDGGKYLVMAMECKLGRPQPYRGELPPLRGDVEALI